MSGKGGRSLIVASVVLQGNLRDSPFPACPSRIASLCASLSFACHCLVCVLWRVSISLSCDGPQRGGRGVNVVFYLAMLKCISLGMPIVYTGILSYWYTIS